MGFDLKANSFFILDVSPRDPAKLVDDNAERLLADSMISEEIVFKAQRELSASKSRLNAELSWLLELTPSRTSEIKAKYLLTSVTTHSREIELLLRELEGLSCANLSAHFCASGEASAEVFQSLVTAWGDLTPYNIRDLVNINRKVSGFPEVSEQLVLEALPQIKEAHVQASHNWLMSSLHPGNTFSTIIQKLLKNNQNSRNFLELVVEKYDLSTIAKLKSFEDQITEIFSSMKETSEPSKNQERAYQIISLLREWDEYNQPAQLLHKDKGLDAPRARRVFKEVREISLWLANEKNDYALSLEFTKSLIEIFPELPISVATLEDDVKTLVELVEKAKTHETLIPVTIILDSVLKDEKPLNNSILAGEFAKNKRGIAGELYNTITTLKEKLQGNPNATEMWSLVRKIGIYLYNEKNCTQAAVTLLIGLLNLSPPEDMRKKLDDDIKTLSHVLTQEQLTVAINAKSFTKARDLAKKLIETAPTEKDSNEWKDVYLTLDKRRTDAITQKVVWGVIIGAIILWSNLSDNHKKSSTTYNSYTPPKYSTPVYQPPVQQNLPPLEIKPSVGIAILNIYQLRWCTFERERIDFISDQFSNTPDEIDQAKSWNSSIVQQWVVDTFQAKVDDYNSRCVNVQYYQNDMSTVKQESFFGKEKRIIEAKQLMLSWNNQFRFKR